MLNGFIMSGNKSVIKVSKSEIEVLDEELMPLYFKKFKSVENQLEKRAIDSHRTNSRILKKALRLNEKDDVSTVLSVNAVTLTDNYWLKNEEGIDLSFIKKFILNGDKRIKNL